MILHNSMFNCIVHCTYSKVPSLLLFPTKLQQNKRLAPAATFDWLIRISEFSSFLAILNILPSEKRIQSRLQLLLWLRGSTVGLCGSAVNQPEVNQDSVKLTDQPKTTIAGVLEQTPPLLHVFNSAGKVANVTSCWLLLSRHSNTLLADIFTVQFHISKAAFKSRQSSSSLLSQLNLVKHFTVRTLLQPSAHWRLLTEPEGGGRNFKAHCGLCLRNAYPC